MAHSSAVHSGPACDILERLQNKTPLSVTRVFRKRRLLDQQPRLVAIMFRLVRALDWRTDVVGLFLGKDCELNTDLIEV